MTSNERFPKGALTHHLQNRRWYPSCVRLVRSPRGMRLLWKPMDDAGKLLSSTQATSAMLYRILFVTCLRKPAPGSFTADMGEPFKRSTHVLFCEREPEIQGKDANQQRQSTIWKRR